MGVCQSADEDSTWQFSIKKQKADIVAEEDRLKKIREEIELQQRLLDVLDAKVNRMTAFAGNASESGHEISSDVSYLMNSQNFQSIFPSLTKDELSNLLHIIMLMITHTHSILSSKGSTMNSSTVNSSTLNSSRASTNLISERQATSEKKDEEPNAEHSGSSIGSLKYVTFTARPFGFEIVVPDPNADRSRPSLPYVHSVTNPSLRDLGIFGGMSLHSINGERILPGTDLATICSRLATVDLPCSMGFSLPEDFCSPLTHFQRRKPKKKKRNRVVVCNDCRTYVKKRHSKRGLDGELYCRECHDSHICEYCNFWSSEVDTRRGKIFCDECLIAEKFITFSGFPLPFSLRPTDSVPVLHDVDIEDSLGLCNGWILTTVNDINVTGQTAYSVISILASAKFPMTLGFKRSNAFKHETTEVYEHVKVSKEHEIGGAFLGKKLLDAQLPAKLVHFPMPASEPIRI